MTTFIPQHFGEYISNLASGNFTFTGQVASALSFLSRTPAGTKVQYNKQYLINVISFFDRKVKVTPQSQMSQAWRCLRSLNASCFLYFHLNAGANLSSETAPASSLDVILREEILCPQRSVRLVPLQLDCGWC